MEQSQSKVSSVIVAGLVVFAAASGALYLGSTALIGVSEQRACESALHEGTRAALEGYLALHPTGDCANQVAHRLEEL